MPKRHKEPKVVMDLSRPPLPPSQWPPEVWAALHRAAQRLGERQNQAGQLDTGKKGDETQ